MAKLSDIPAAFPGGGEKGITVRDYFASAVVAALISKPTGGAEPSKFAAAAYAIADAMMAERAK